MKRQAWGPEAYLALSLGRDWRQKPFPCPLLTFLASRIDFQHIVFLFFRIKSFMVQVLEVSGLLLQVP